MANKRITELQLREDFDATCNVPIDDSVQSYRTTGQQILDFIKENSVATTTERGMVKLLGEATANSNINKRSFQASIQGVGNTITQTIARPSYASNVLITVSVNFRYGNGNGTPLETGVAIRIKDGVSVVAEYGSDGIIVPTGFNGGLSQTYTAIVGYPDAANFTVEANEFNIGGGSYSATNCILCVSVSAIKVGPD